jgi:hypothetical protein
MTSVLQKVGSHWFAAAPASRPAMLRILIGGYALWYVWDRRKMLHEMARGGDPKLYRPVGLARIQRTPPPPRLVQAVIAATLAANVAAVAGIHGNL